jgi:phosphoglycerate kinase
MSCRGFGVAMKTIRDLDFNGKKVLVRVDYNVPIDASGKIEDDTRIKETLPTLNYLLEKNSAVILMSHFGRPKGKRDLKYSLKPIVPHLENLLGRKVYFAEDCVGEKAQQAASQLRPGEILLLENLRFHPEEEKNDENFARALASLADFYVNDAFGSAHRAHASTAGVPHYLPSAAGFLLEKELQALSRLLVNPDRPYVVVLGGAKVSDKLGVLQNLLPKVDWIFIGGAMAFTFLKSLGYHVGKSLVEEEKLLEVSALYKNYEKKIKLPVDVVCAPSIEEPEKKRVVKLSKEDNSMIDWQGFDIGPETLKLFSEWMETHMPRTIFWNGPMGVFEVPDFATGTLEVGKILASCSAKGSHVVVGGGDSVSALHQLGLASHMTHISTGGGASLEFLEGKVLPGLASLEQASQLTAH